MKNIGVFAVIQKENKILLEKRNYGNFGWTLPGGSVEKNEKITEALKREVMEETNQEINVEKYILTSYDIEKYSIALIYKCKIINESKIKFNNTELSEVKWININEINKMLTKRQQTWVDYALNNLNGVLEI